MHRPIHPPSGRRLTGVRKMTTQTKTTSVAQLSAAGIVAIIGIVVIAVTGHVQAATLHDAAHDVRHATGFPCH